MDNWICEQLASLSFGDKRLDRRIKLMCEQMAENPQPSINATFGTWAEVQAAYRALNNEKVKSAEIRSALQQACVQQLDPGELVLVIQDTSTFEFNSHRATQGLGPTASAKGRPAGHGFHLHSALAVTTEGVPLGVLHQQVKVRDAKTAGIKHQRAQRPIKEKESYRWPETSQKVHDAVPEQQPLLQIADREGDLFELLAERRRANSFILIRSAHNRRVICAQTGKSLCLNEAVASAPFSGSFTAPIGRRPGQLPREAQIAIRFGQVEVQIPKNGIHDPELAPVQLTIIEAIECSVPPPNAKPIHWLLFTDLPVGSFDEARRCVHYYTLRWLIERYHFTLKSGCQMEDSQLKTFEGLDRLLALYCAVALRLLRMTYLARVDGQQPCTALFTTAEWQVLYCYHHRNSALPQEPPTLHEAVVWTARLGGFLARKGDGEPGVKVLWRGLTRLQDMTLSLLLFSSRQDVCKE
jgi:Transposase DNA-binding/Transposase Tn5 dimerisation domain